MNLNDLEFRVLGPIEVARDGVAIGPVRPKEKALLSSLLINIGSTVAADHLLDALWPDAPPDRGRNALWVHISGLRKTLEPDRAAGRDPEVLITDSPGYALHIDPHQIDSVQFELLAKKARAVMHSDPAGARAELADALALWRGRPYEDVSYADFAQSEIMRLDEAKLTAIEDRLRCDLALGHTRTVLDELTRLTADHPLREALHGIQMLAWYRAGEQTEALRIYQSFRNRLADELGIVPSPSLRRLEERILVQDPTLARPDDRPATNLPRPLPRFVGRSDEVAAIRDQLAAPALWTLTGQGGVGKTTLAVEVARSLVTEFADGVWFVDLAAIDEPSLVARAVASVTCPGEDATADPGSLADALASRNELIVLDNCEHLVDACATLAERISASAPQVAILATSRRRLGVRHEHVWRVEPLEVPSEETPRDEWLQTGAMQLLVDAVRTRDRSFVLTDAGAASLATICRHLDGVPFAMELAAAQIATFGPSTVAERLPAQVLSLETDVLHDSPRHRSLAASLQWSYRSLSADERLLFRRLSVFRGSFDLDAAEAVTSGAPIERSEVPRLIRHLVDASMLQPIDGATGRRFRMLAVVRLFAQRAAEGDDGAELGRRHAEHFCALSVEAGIGLRSNERSTWLERITTDYENLRAASAWSLDHADAMAAFRHLDALGPFWSVKSAYAQEGAALAQRLLEQDVDGRADLRARALLTIASTRRYSGDLDEVMEMSSRAVELLEPFESTAAARECACLVDALNLRGLIAMNRRGDDPFVHLERARAVGGRSQYVYGAAITESYAGMALGNEGRWNEAVGRLEQACAMLRQLDRGRAYANVLGYLGRTAFLDGDHDRALRLMHESIAIDRRKGARQDSLFAFNGLAVVHLARGELVAARSALERSLAESRGFVLQRSTSIALVAVFLAEIGALVPAATLLEAADEMRVRHGYVGLSPFTRAVTVPARVQVEAGLDARELSLACARGRQTSDVEASDLAESALRSEATQR